MPAIVAVAITKTVAIRRPARTSGNPSGSSTRTRICASVSPIPREVRVREDRRDREHDEGHGVVPEADAEDGDPETDHRDARQGPAERGHAESEEQPAMPVPEPEAERQGDQERDPEGGEG